MDLTKQQLELIESDMAKYSPVVQERYRQMVAAGQHPRMAAMFAAQQAPGTLHTDKTFNEHRRQRMNSMKPHQLAAYNRIARKAGISTQGKFYVGALGRPSDPAAWVSTVDEAKHTCKVKNLTTEDGGLWSHKGVESPPPKRVKMAKDIKKAYVSEYLKEPCYREKLQKDPGYIRDLEHQIEAVHGSGQ